MFKRLKQILRKALLSQAIAEDAEVALEKFDVELTDNMRALRLVATIAEQLLSRGVAASDVVHMSLRIASMYCSRKVHIDVSNTILTLSQDRGIDREPLTMMRTVTYRGADYRAIQRLEEFVRTIRSGRMTLDDAEKGLDVVLTQRRPYPRWVTHMAAGGLSAGVVILYSANPAAWLVAFVMGVLVSMTLYRTARLGLPSFYSQALAGMLVTVIAAIAALATTNGVVPILDEVNPTLIVVAGLVMLVAGMMVVSAFQDAIDEYYVTAVAHLLKVAMLTGGVVLGVTAGLYVATQLGVSLTTTPEGLSLSAISYQYIGAALMSASFALGNQARPIAVISSGVVGFLSLYIVLILTSLGFGVIASSGIAAAFVGLSATVLLHLFHTPTIATINAGIIPLVPGLTLYSGLTYIAQASPNTTEFDTGVALLLRALLIAVIVAAGATLGNLIGRPSRRRLIHYQNRLPARRLSAHRKDS